MNIFLPLLLQVRVHVYESADHLPRRPILGRSSGERLIFERGASGGWGPGHGTSAPSPEAARWAGDGGQACHHVSGGPVVGTGPGVDSPVATAGMRLAPLQR